MRLQRVSIDWTAFTAILFNVTMLLLLLGILGAFGAEDGDPLCQMLRSPEHCLLSKEGDVTIGGVFSIHSQISSPLLSFTDTPNSLTCSRYYMGLLYGLSSSRCILKATV